MNGHFPFGDVNPIKYFLVAAVGLGVLFGFIAPDSEHGLLVDLLQWQLQSVIPITILILVHIYLSDWKFLSHRSSWVRVAISGVIGATLFAPIALALDIIILSEPFPQTWLVELIDEWLGVAPPITICWLLLNLPWLAGGTYTRVNSKEFATNVAIADVAQDGSDSQTPGFYSLLDDSVKGTLLAMSSELHYLQVYTNKGHQLILYSLYQAIDELPQDLGMQVHRSHWVAFEAIISFNKKGRQGEITLLSGQKIPVSRSLVADVTNRVKLSNSQIK
ncbi:MAG: hypothetical protein Alis3KO_14360 [Aliiglaciecola sp.]